MSLYIYIYIYIYIYSVPRSHNTMLYTKVKDQQHMNYFKPNTSHLNLCIYECLCYSYVARPQRKVSISGLSTSERTLYHKNIICSKISLFNDPQTTNYVSPRLKFVLRDHHSACAGIWAVCTAVKHLVFPSLCLCVES